MNVCEVFWLEFMLIYRFLNIKSYVWLKIKEYINE